MARGWQNHLQRWLGAGLFNAATAESIRAYEKDHESEEGMRWPVLVAWVFGGILVGAGVLLFVAAHWEELSPGERFSLVLLMVALFHVAGAFVTGFSQALATVLHAVGTTSLGAGIFLAGQIFHLQEHWPGGVMLWALGAWLAWALLGDWAQVTLAAILTPIWIAGEWIVATETYHGHDLILAAGLALLALIYFTARTKEQDSALRRALVWLGGLSLIPFVFYLALQRNRWWSERYDDIPLELILVGWVVALGLPLALGNLLRGKFYWRNFLLAGWVVLLATTTRIADNAGLFGYAWEELGPYLLCGLLAVGLVWWGLQEAKREQINMGIAGFGLTVLFFYFSTVMDKLGRSGSLISLGALFLVLGWSLHRTRRRLLAQLEKTEEQESAS